MSDLTSKQVYRILVVDDNRSIHEDFRKILCSAEPSSELSDLEATLFGDSAPQVGPSITYQVDFALQGEEALKMVQAAVEEGCHYALAFVDMRMPPGWDGLKTIEHLWEVDPEIQAVICTAYSDHSWADIAQRLIKQDQWLILKKPFDNVEVCQHSAALTQKWKLQRESRQKLVDLENTVDSRTSALREEIKERKDAESALREQESRLRAIVDTAPDGIIVFDDSGRIEMVNQAACVIFGYSREELCEKTIALILEDCQHLRDDVSLVTRELKGHRKDGSVMTVQLTLSEFTSGGCRRFTGIVRDLTEFKQLQCELAQSQKLESVGQLAAGIAHEINTPTQYVGDNVRFLNDAFNDVSLVLEELDKLLFAAKEGSVNGQLVADVEATLEQADIAFLKEEIPVAISQSVEGVERVAKIVRAMKEFSHPGSDEKTLVDLNQALETTIAVSRHEWKYVATIETRFDPELPDIPCLPGELKQVFLNLIVNAAHAIGDAVGEDCSEKGTITLSTRRRGDWAEVLVQDTGTGIPEEVRSRIFDPFFTTKGVGKGTGQGLAIARSVVVDKHKGTIDCHSEPGNGTTFIVQLPIDANQITDGAEKRNEDTTLVC